MPTPTRAIPVTIWEANELMASKTVRDLTTMESRKIGGIVSVRDFAKTVPAMDRPRFRGEA